jgi:8-oxo-dGTP pyrophosphatase MutT (NUDIX family)
VELPNVGYGYPNLDVVVAAGFGTIDLKEEASPVTAARRECFEESGLLLSASTINYYESHR